MNLLVLSNMKPSKQQPTFGMFVGNQVAALEQSGQFAQLLFIGNTLAAKGKLNVIKKYLVLLWSVLQQAVFNRTRYDVVHVHYFYPTIWFAIVYKLLRNWRCKIVVTFHGSDVQLYARPPWLYKLASGFVDHHVFVSQGLANDYFKSVDDADKSILSAGILDLYNQQGADVEKQYDFVIVGALTELKGLDRLMALLDSFEHPVKVAVIGAGPMRAQLSYYHSDIHQLDLLGSCLPPQVKKVLHQSRFLISLSRHESFGLVMTEAMACGTPVIATKTNGSAVQVEVNQNGYLLENCDDIDQFVKLNCPVLMQALVNLDKAAYDNLSANAVNCATSHRISRVVESLLAIYRQLH